MIGFLTPFFIAFGIGAGVAIVLAALAGLAVVLREMLLLGWGVAREVARWPGAALRGAPRVADEFRREMTRLESRREH